MTPTDIATLLMKVTAYDLRTVGEADVLAWHEAVGDIDLADALSAVGRHYRESTERIMPAHLRRIVRDIRADRRRLEEKSAPRQLPGKLEDDPDRDERMARGIAQVRAVLDELAERWAMPK